MKKIIMLIGTAMLLLLNVQIASACFCPTIGSPKSNLAEKDAVFQGQIVTAKLHDGKREWIMIVDRVWKGDVEERITIRDLSDPDSSCAFNFKLKGRYIIFAYTQTSKGNVIYNPANCTWTTALNKYRIEGKLAEEYIYQALGEGEIPKKKISDQKFSKDKS